MKEKLSYLEIRSFCTVKRCVLVSRSAERSERSRSDKRTLNTTEGKKVYVENGLEKIECLKMVIGGLSWCAVERRGAFTGWESHIYIYAIIQQLLE